MATDERKDTAQTFRAGAGIILRRGDGQVLMCLRKDVQSWSFPQGGLEPGETFIGAAYREMNEELGIKAELALDLPVLAGVYPGLLSYLIPPIFKKEGKVGIGQTIQWLLFDYARRSDQYVFEAPEFERVEWFKPTTLFEDIPVSPFKRTMYRQVAKWVQEVTL